MRDNCLFCEKELNMMQKKKLYCGHSTQTVCGDCYRRYKELNSVERAEAALNTGRAEDEAKIREYLDPIREMEKAKAEKQKAQDEQRKSGKSCLRCGADMLDYGDVTFKLGEETFFFSDMNRLASGSLTMKVLRCQSCGKAEFYIPDAEQLEKAAEQNKN